LKHEENLEIREEKKDRITTNLKELGIVSSRDMETWDPGALSTVCPFHLKSEKPEGGKMI